MLDFFHCESICSKRRCRPRPFLVSYNVTSSFAFKVLPQILKRKIQIPFRKNVKEKAIVATPLPSDLLHEMKIIVLSERERILSQVKEYINKNLDPKNEIF